ncbi:MAG TPA: response regulator [Candidatus Dormibacteraeota bacterium]|nr:response regulator [Candidatus Dormibacteraeota bacterium]
MQSDENREGASILIVEDDEDVREAMIAFLEMKGYSVASAGNGREALDYLRDAPAPDLIITDLAMPVMDGRQFRREQLKDARLAAIPTLVITAMADRTHIDASEILLKPVDADVLLTAVSRHCGSEPVPQ